MSLTTMAAIIGRLITGVFIDHVNRRLVASVNFLIQAIALGAMITWPTDLPLYLACVGVGLTVGNMTSLSALIVQQEFPKERFGTVISLIVAFNQLTFAFGPGVIGVIRDVTDSYTPSLLLCILVHSFAAGMVLLRYGIKAPDPLPNLASTHLYRPSERTVSRRKPEVTPGTLLIQDQPHAHIIVTTYHDDTSGHTPQ